MVWGILSNKMIHSQSTLCRQLSTRLGLAPQLGGRVGPTLQGQFGLGALAAPYPSIAVFESFSSAASIVRKDPDILEGLGL